MAYADALRQAVYNPSTTADLIEQMLLQVEYRSSYSSTISTSSTSFVTTGLSSSVTVEEGETVLAFATLTMSSGTADGKAAMYVYRDSTATNGMNSIGSTINASSFGQANNMFFFSYDQPSSGTYTYDLKWKLEGSGYTVYSRYGTLILLKLRDS